MGGLSSKFSDLSVSVKTGGKEHAGTDNNVFLVLYDKDGTESATFTLDNFLHDDFESNKLDTFGLGDAKELGKLKSIKIWREGYFDDDWYVEHIIVTRKSTQTTRYFPIHRWIPMNEPLHIQEFDNSLPQFDPNREQRVRELEIKRVQYGLIMDPELPFVISKDLIEDDQFSASYLKAFKNEKKQNLRSALWMKLFTKPFKNLEEMEACYGGTYPLPRAAHSWKDDRTFGNQRLSGVNPLAIELCTRIPSNFAVTDELVRPFLEGHTIEAAIAAKRLFIIDLKIMDKLFTNKKQDYMCAPLALFYLNNTNQLLPVAIQLMQEPAQDNPVFLPSDPPYTWLLAKIWYNAGECCVHQATSHLAFTHLIMESVCTSTHRQLSPSHPIMRILAPHFMHLIAINHTALSRLINPGGWIDNTMSMQVVGLKTLTRRAMKWWKMDVDGHPIKQIEKRGVLDEEVLPNYSYRDDAILLFNAIEKYVRTVVNGIYDTKEKLIQDYEIQGWAKELAAPYPDGVGLPGVPGGGKFENNADLITTVTIAIYQCSVGHAAVNFMQYDSYGFPPAYMAKSNAKRINSKDPKEESDIIATIPDHSLMIQTLVVTKLLSIRATEPLGHYEVQYAFDSLSVDALKTFQEDLAEIEATINQRNSTRPVYYDILLPSLIPNSITI